MIKVLKKDVIYSRWGTRESLVEFEGDYTKEDIDAHLATDAPYGWHLEVNCIDSENKRYKGTLDEYWD